MANSRVMSIKLDELTRDREILIPGFSESHRMPSSAGLLHYLRVANNVYSVLGTPASLELLSFCANAELRKATERIRISGAVSNKYQGCYGQISLFIDLDKTVQEFQDITEEQSQSEVTKSEEPTEDILYSETSADVEDMEEFEETSSNDKKNNLSGELSAPVAANSCLSASPLVDKCLPRVSLQIVDPGSGRQIVFMDNDLSDRY